jgi:hypothetical protein
MIRMLTQRDMLISTMPGLGVATLGIPFVRASDWRSQFATPNLGVVSSENEADRIRINTWDEVAFILIMILLTVTLINLFSKTTRGRFI